MNFYEYQKKAMRCASMTVNENEQLLNAALGICGEAGELAGHVKKFYFQGEDFPKETIVSTAGNVLWCIALLCESMGIDLEDVVTYNMDKLQKKYPEAYDHNEAIDIVGKL